MKITEYSIKKPITILIAVVAAILAGIYAFMNMSFDLIPNINYPIIAVTVQYSGATSGDIENLVTSPIEKSVSSVNGITSIESHSMDNYTVLLLNFDFGTDLEKAKNNVRDKLDSISALLPSDVNTPTVSSVDLRNKPIATISVTGSDDAFAISKSVADDIIPMLERIDGVASVGISSDVVKQIEVNLDPAKLEANMLDINQMTAIINAYGMVIPSGTTKQNDSSLSIKGEKYITDIDSIKKMNFINPMGKNIMLRDVADVSLKEVAPESLSQYNGKNMVTVNIFKTQDGNITKVIDEVTAEVQQLSDSTGLKLDFIKDQSEFINTSLAGVFNNLIVGVILAVFIICIFLRSVKGAIIISVSIPLSLIFTLLIMYALGISLNIVSLAGLAISVGMVVDSSIVVLERMTYYKDRGETALRGAINGSKSVGGAVIASTITTIAVFLPVIVTDGFSKEIFSQVSIVVTCSLLISLLVAFTVVPLMFKLFYSKTPKVISGEKRNIFTRLNVFVEKGFKNVENGYKWLVKLTVHFRKTTILITVILSAACLCLVSSIGFEFMPNIDQSEINISVTMPTGTSLETTNKRLWRLKRLFQILLKLRARIQFPVMQTIWV